MKQILLIEELTPTQSKVIEESVGKDLFLSGIFMQADIKNRNGRNYPLNEISRAVTEAQARIQETNGIFGELDHPQSLTINLDRISHVITDIRMEGSNAIGRARLLDTPMGKIAKTLVESGVRLGVSSRGAGAVNESGGVTGFNFITVDIVATPSAPGAIPNSIYEGVEAAKNGHNIITLAEQVQNDPAAQKYLKQEIMKWINSGIFKRG